MVRDGIMIIISLCSIDCFSRHSTLQKNPHDRGLKKLKIKFLPTQSLQSYPPLADTIPATYPSYFHLYPSNLYH